MMVAVFLVTNQTNWVKFFEKIFLVANISPDVIFEIPFFTLSNTNINFPKRKLWWRSYNIKKAFFTIKRVKLVGKKEFIVAILDPKYETFVVHIVFLESFSNNQENNVYCSCRVQIAALIANEAPNSISTEYFDFINVFSPKIASKLLEYTIINNYTIKSVNNWQSFYKSIYSLGLIEFETLKTCIKTNLANSFIRPSKFPARASIYFDKKSNGSFQLCVNYWRFNNFTIKNQ